METNNKKHDLGPQVAAYPMPVCLIGANVEGKANFLAAAYVMAVSYNPPRMAVALNKAHYTNQGIKEQKTFSICIPSEEMVNAADYCGIVSGAKEDKSKVFEVFYGKLSTAPLIAECPVCYECKLENAIDGGSHELFIGEVASTFTANKYLTDGRVDIEKTKPFILSYQRYYGVGKPVADAWKTGIGYKKA